jgi:hypothetical protein
MTIHSQHPSNINSLKGTKLWDPATILGIINSDPGYQCITCIGFAPSQRRRCRNPINASNRSYIFDVLENISYLDPAASDVARQLRSIASSALCVRFHQGQANNVLENWFQKIDELKCLERRKTPSKRGQNSTSRCVSSGLVTSFSESFEGQTDEELQTLYARMNDELNRRQKAEEKRQQQQRRREKERLDRENQESEKQEREEQEREKQEREKQQREKQQREKRDNEERKRRAKQQSEQQERARQQTKREEKERKQRTAKKQKLWAEYEKKWLQFKTSEVKTKRTRQLIPWPVESGLYKDVSAESVKSFLQDVTPKDVSMEKLMRKEARNWHSDTRDRVFNGVVLTEQDVEMMEMICRVVTDLLNDSAKRSSDTF